MKTKNPEYRTYNLKLHTICSKSCHPDMIMSHYTDLEMSHSKHGIIPLVKGGYYGRKGHYHNEQEGIHKNTSYI